MQVASAAADCLVAQTLNVGGLFFFDDAFGLQLERKHVHIICLHSNLKHELQLLGRVEDDPVRDCVAAVGNQ